MAEGSARQAVHPAGRAWLWATAALTVGAIATCAVLAPPGTARAGTALTWLLFTGAPVHVAATGWLFTKGAVRRHARAHLARYLWAPLAAVALAAALAAAAPPAGFAYLLLPYFAWQFFHFQKQNLGVSALAAAACRVAPLSAAERRALLASGGAGVAGLMAHPALLGLSPALPARPGGAVAMLAWGVFTFAAALFGVAALAGVAAISRRPAAHRPAGFSALYVTALAFPLPVFAFTNPYAAVAGMTAAHGLQYLVLVSLVAVGGPGGGASRILRLGALASIALAGGAVLSAASHLHSAGPAGRLLFGAYLGIVMAHFVVDAGLWRMREPFPRAFIATHLPYLAPGPRQAQQASVREGPVPSPTPPADDPSETVRWHVWRVRAQASPAGD